MRIESGIVLVLFCQPLLGTDKPLIDCRLRTVQNVGDLAVREALPSGEEQHLTIAGCELPHGPAYVGVLLALHYHGFRVGQRWITQLGDPYCESTKAMGAPPLMRQDPARHSIEPGQSPIATGDIVTPTPRNSEHFRRCVISIGSGSTADTVRQHLPMVPLIEAVEPGFSSSHTATLSLILYVPGTAEQWTSKFWNREDIS